MSFAPSNLTDLNRKSAKKDEALRNRIESELQKKRLHSNTSSQPTTRKGNRTAAKGTLAALRPAPALTVPESTSVLSVCQLCAAKRVDCALVYDGEGLTGIVTFQDLTYRVIADDLDPRVTLVRQIMTLDPVTCPEQSSAVHGLELMISNKIRHLPVTNDAEGIVGVVGLNRVFYETLREVERKSSASEQLHNAMTGLVADRGSDEVDSGMLTWVKSIRRKTALPDLSSIIDLSTQPVTVSARMSVHEAAQLMKDNHMTAVCIMDVPTLVSGSAQLTHRVPRLMGIFTTGDIALRVIAARLDAVRCSVVRVMTPHPNKARSTISIIDAVKMMDDGFYLPIVGDDDRLVALLDVHTLAEATQEQVTRANQDTSIPDTADGPMWGRFFDSLGDKTQFSSIYNAVSLSDYNERPSDSRSAYTSVSMSGKTLVSSDWAPSSDNPTSKPEHYVFKFRAPGGMNYRLFARQDDYYGLQALVAEKLAMDPMFDEDSLTAVGVVPDPYDFRISYIDEDDDMVFIESDRDVYHAVTVARRASNDRVMLTVHGGKSWFAIAGSGRQEKGKESAVPKPDTAEWMKPQTSMPDTHESRWMGTEPAETQEAPPLYTPAYEAGTPGIDPEVAKERKEETKHYPATEKVVNNERALIAHFTTVFSDIHRYKQLLKVPGAGAQKLLDAFQTLLDIPGLSEAFRRNMLVATLELSKKSSLYPTCYNLEDIELVDHHPVAAGGFADIHKGRFFGQVVCLKIIRTSHTSEVQSFLKQFSSEAILWGQLSHPNLLPIYGLYRYSGRLCLVSPWLDNGNIGGYLQRHPDVNRPLLVSDVASGIFYLHGHDIVHGDLKGANILVDSSGRACLADFGISAVSDPSILHWSTHSLVGSKGGSIRWQAPELFDIEADEIVHNTKPSDVYAFACVAYEVFSGNIPFAELTRESAVIIKVRSGSWPSRPHPLSPAWSSWGLTETFWSLMEACWSAQPDKRPNIHDIVSKPCFNDLLDDRPRDIDDILSPANFRDSVGARTALPSVADVKAMMNDMESEDETLSGSSKYTSYPSRFEDATESPSKPETKPDVNYNSPGVRPDDSRTDASASMTGTTTPFSYLSTTSPQDTPPLPTLRSTPINPLENKTDHMDRTLPQPVEPFVCQYTTQYIGANEAYTHATNKEAEIKDVLIRTGFEGTYSLHAGFNEEKLYLGQQQEEIYLVLDRNISDEVCKTLDDFLAPFPFVVYMPQGAHVKSSSTSISRQFGDGLHLTHSGHVLLSNLTLAQNSTTPSGAGLSSSGGASKGEGGSGGSKQNKGDKNVGEKQPTDNSAGGGPGEPGKASNPQIKASDDDDTRQISIPFISTIMMNPSQDSRYMPTEFTTDSRVNIMVNKNFDGASPPSGDIWPGPWFEVDLQRLTISTNSGSAELFEYTLGLCQIRVTAARRPMSLINYLPAITHVQEDTIKVKRDRTSTWGGWFTVAMNPSFRLGGQRASTDGTENNQRRWEIALNPIIARQSTEGAIQKTGMMWKYLYNGEYAQGKQKVFKRITGGSFEPTPSVVFGIANNPEQLMPLVEVEVTSCWFLNSAHRHKGKKDLIPAFPNFLHRTSVSVDLENLGPGKWYVVGLTGQDSRTVEQLKQADGPLPLEMIEKNLETAKGTTGISKCDVMLKQALEGRIKPLNRGELRGESRTKYVQRK